MKRAILVLAMIVISAGLNHANASAATYHIDFTVNGAGTCTNTNWSFSNTVSWNVPAEPLTLHNTEKVNGMVTFDSTFPSLISGSGIGLGIIRGLGSFNATQPYTVTSILKFSTRRLGIFSAWRFQGTCSGDVLTVVANKLPLGGTVAAVPDPSIPEVYVLKTITCTEAVFDSPAGNPVGDNKVTAGQTFYVSTKSVKGSDGRMWSQIFVSSDPNPWILTSCAH